MRVTTTRFGELEVADSEIITFPRGILGFEAVKQYILLDGSGPFGFLQAIEEPDLTFVVIDPRFIVQEYKVEVPKYEVQEIEIEEPSQAVALSIVTIPANPQEMTVNLQAPLLINPSNRRAKQVVLTDHDYNMRHPVFGTVGQSA
ncbi:MAG: flagellar assembly protein FliW [Firmicutes bacterium]|nr:flagellar assembly protein FliW [Bacillota bacterium]